MELVDVHCHLYPPAFQLSEIGSLLQDAQNENVIAIINVSESLDNARDILELADSHPILHPCAGLHPTQHNKCVSASELDDMVHFIESNHKRLVAIGEIGLDFSPLIASQADQKETQRFSSKSARKSDQYLTGMSSGK